MTLIDDLARALRYFVDRDYTFFNGKATHQHTLGVTREQVIAARDALARYAATKAADNGRTHWEGCWRDPKHHACAVAKIEELQAEGAQAPVAWLAVIGRLSNPYITELFHAESAAKAYIEMRPKGFTGTVVPLYTASPSLPEPPK